MLLFGGSIIYNFIILGRKDTYLQGTMITFKLCHKLRELSKIKHFKLVTIALEKLLDTGALISTQ